jgi:hypothetical protein
MAEHGKTAGKGAATLLIDYWLAGQVGRAWDRLRPGRGRTRGRGPAACDAVARGDRAIPAGDLVAAQEFAARMWFVVGLACLAVVFAVALPAEALPRGGWRDALADGLLAPGLLAVTSLSQMGLISYRRNQTSRYVLRGGPAAAARPSGARRGLPRRTDFWLILAIAIAVSVFIYYVRTYPSA